MEFELCLLCISADFNLLLNVQHLHFHFPLSCDNIFLYVPQMGHVSTGTHVCYHSQQHMVPVAHACVLLASVTLH